MENFQSLGLPEVLLQSLKTMGFTKPTPIQAQAIPVALEGRDVLGSAQTGTGKTAAYLIPLVVNLLNNKNANALVLTPTRELATQVLDAVKQFLGKASDVRTALLIGGDPMFKQLNQLKNNPRIIVGTPGRINDHLLRKSLNLRNTSFVVFDETDRMLDLGFSVQLKEIAKYLPQERQTLLFSATMAPEILKIAYSYLTDSVRITVGSTTSPVKNVKQEVVKTSEAEKYSLLLNQLEECSGSHIVFVKTKSGADKLAGKLQKLGHAADALHGDLRQRNRDKIIKEFRDYKHRILVATDVAARGLDIPHLQCVVNYDLPQCPEDYIHRVGRVGRAGAEGIAVSLLTAQDGAKWKAICKLIGTKIGDVGDDFVAENTNRNRSSARPGRKPQGQSTGRSDGPFSGFKSRGDSAKPSRFGRDDSKPYSFDRSAKPSRFGKTARPARFDGDAKPAAVDIDSRPASSFDRAARPSRFSRDDAKPSSFDRSAKPSRFGKAASPARFDGESKPSSDRKSRPVSGFDRAARPAARSGRDDSKPSRFGRDDAKPANFDKDSKTLKLKSNSGRFGKKMDSNNPSPNKPFKPKRKFSGGAR